MKIKVFLKRIGMVLMALVVFPFAIILATAEYIETVAKDIKESCNE